MTKRILCFLLVLVMLFGTVSAAGADSFKDVSKDQWYYTWVDRVVTAGYFKGYSDTEFAPNETITRAMLATVLYRLSGEKNTSTAQKFTDVPAGQWYSDAIAWAESKGIVNGMGNGQFAPNSPVLREQIAAIVSRFITYMQSNYSVTYAHLKTYDAVSFADQGKISSWANTGVEDCQKYGLINGFPPAAGQVHGQFKPQDTATRAQVAKIIWMLSEILANGRSSALIIGGGGAAVHLHTLKWNYNETEHWMSCACTYVTNRAAHNYVAGKCECGRSEDKPQHTHVWATEWIKDATHHWHTCSGCEEKNDYGVHAFTNGFCECGAKQYTVTYQVSDGTNWSALETVVYTEAEFSTGITVKALVAPDWSDGTYNYTFKGWATTPNGGAGDILAAGTPITSFDGANSEVLYAVYEGTPIVGKSYTVTYQVTDGTNWTVLETKTYTEAEFSTGITVADLAPADYTKDGVVYLFAGWSTTKGGAAELKAGDAVAFGAETDKVLYAAYTETDDYVFAAVEAVVDQMQALAEKLSKKNVSASVAGNSYTASLGTFDAAVTVGDLNYSATGPHTVKATAEGALGADVVERMLEIATTYALSILGPDPLPTKTEIKDMVKDAAAELKVTIPEKSLQAIADSAYSKTKELAQPAWKNFRNFNGKYCISAIDMEGGKLVLSVNDAQGLVSMGSKVESVKACRALVSTIARELYADLLSTGGSVVENGMNVVELNSTITVEFTQAAGVPVYPAVYEIDLTAKLASDMVAYSWDAATGLGTVTLVIPENIQTQYTESLEAVLQASLTNGTMEEKLNAIIDGALSSSDLVKELKTMAGEAAIKSVMTNWVKDNLVVTGNANAYSLYEFLWTNEGTLKANSGVYTTGDAKVLGINDRLYAFIVDTMETMAKKLAPTVLAAAKDLAGDYWTSSYLSSDNRRGLLKIGIDTELNKETYSALSQENKNYLINQIIVEAAKLDSSLGDASAEAAAAAQFAGSTRTLVDQMIMKAVATASVKGQTLPESMAMAVRFKTIERMQTVEFAKIAKMMEDSTFQSIAGKKGNAYVHYLASAITRLPAGATLTVNGVALNEAALANVQSAAKNNNTAAVCNALADLLQDTALRELSMNSFAAGQKIVVSYNSRVFTFLAAMEIA